MQRLPLTRPSGNMTLLNAGSPQAQGLVAWWPYPSGDRVHQSLAGIGGMLTPTAMRTAQGAREWFGEVADNDGVSKYFTLPDMTARITSGTGGTFSMWIRRRVAHTASSAPTAGAWAIGTSASDSHYSFTDGNIYDGALIADRPSVGAGVVTDRTTWHLLTVTITPAGAWVFYQNARPATSLTGKTFGLRAAPLLGNSITSGTYGGDFQITDIRFYNRALSAAEVHQLWNPATRWELYQAPILWWPQVAAGGGGTPTIDSWGNAGGQVVRRRSRMVPSGTIGIKAAA